MFERVTAKNGHTSDNVLTASAEFGLVSQEQFFNRRVASSDIRGYTLLQRGDFAYNKSYSAGYPVGVIRRLERYPAGVLSPLYICFRLANRDHDETFLSWFFKSGAVDDQIAFMAKEGARNHGLLNVAVGDFFDVELVLPPLPEQQLIASILDTVDEVIRKTEEVIAKLQQMKQGLLHDLLTRGIDDNGELRDPDRHPEQFKDSPLGRIPKDWGCKTVRELLFDGTVIGLQDGNHGEAHPTRSDFVSEGIPFVMANNIRNGYVDIASCLRISESMYRSLRVGFAQRGDVLISHKGTLGEVAVVDRETRLMLTPQVTYYRCNPQRLLNRYLAFWFRGAECRRQLAALGAQSTRAFVSITGQRQILILVPDLPEQEKIANALEASEEAIESEQSELSKLRLLKSGLMDDLLTGRVRVTDLLP